MTAGHLAECTASDATPAAAESGGQATSGVIARPAPNPVREAAAAAALLTRLPIRVADERTGSAAFPLVGAVLASLAAVPAALLAGPAPLLGAMLALGLIELASGGLHLDGLADTADALAAPDDTRAEVARKDPRVGSAGAGAIVVVLGAAAGALVAIPGWAVIGAAAVAGAASRATPALAAPMLGRNGPAAPGFGSWFAARSGRGGAVVALLILAIVVAVAAAANVALGPASGFDWMFVAAPVAGAVAGLGAGVLLSAILRRRFGGLVGDHYGAAVEIAFLGGLAAQALAWGL